MTFLGSGSSLSYKDSSGWVWHSVDSEIKMED